MSGPLTLRLCCLAAMAPALTEATAQSTRMKLPGSPTQSSNTPVRNGRDQIQAVQTNGTVRRSLPSKVTRFPHLSPLSGQASVNGDGTPGAKTPAVAVNPDIIQTNLKKNLENYTSGCSSFVQTASLNRSTRTDPRGRMNQPAPPIENKPGKDLSASSATPTTSRTHTQQPSTFVNGKGGLHQAKESKSRSANAMGHRNYHSAMAPVLISKNPPETYGDFSDTRDDQPGSDQNDIDEVSMYHDAKSNLCKLERKKQRILCRLRRLQCKHLTRRVSQQMSQYVDFQQKNLQTVAKTSRSSTDSANPPGPSDFKNELFQSDKVRNLSTAALVSLVQTLQANNSLNSQRAASNAKPETSSVLTIDSTVRKESQLTADHLLTCLHHAKLAVDSDATESSSGGESCDEDESEAPKDKKFQHAPLHRRAEWKFSKERAAVVARWTWLQAQVSDLEYRIRQQGDIHKQVRATKGPIQLEEPADAAARLALRSVRSSKSDSSVEVTASSSQTSVNTMLSNINKQASQLTQSLGNCVSPGANSLKAVTPSPTRALNGVIDSPTSNTSEIGHGEMVGSGTLDSPGAVSLPDSQDSSSFRAARCYPLVSYKKRKLFRTAGLHLTHRKAARLSTVKCHCYPPVTPCPTCGGRYNNTQPVDPDVMPLHERIAILDASYHPVLSFPQDTPLPIHFEAMLRTGEWQNKPQSRRPRTDSDKRRQKVSQINGENRKVPRAIRKNVTAAYLQSQKIRNKYENKAGRKPGNGGRGGAPTQQLKRRRALMVNRQNKVHLASISNAGSRSGTPLPSPSSSLSMSCPTSAFKDAPPVRRRRGESTFDINNIVIPYSIASTAKVEQLNYKPIDIPKWRDLTEEQCEEEEALLVAPPTPMEVDRLSPVPMEEDPGAEDEEVSSDEDISDNSYQKRHQKCEEEEKLRFMPQVHPTARRGRARMESQLPSQDIASQDARSTLDQDPMSQSSEMSLSFGLSSALAAHLQGMPSSPRPSTPLVAMDESSQDRRRTFSMSRRDRLSASTQSQEEQGEGGLELDGGRIEPWPNRSFPLTDEEYEVMRQVQPPLVDLPRPVEGGANPECRSDNTPSSSLPCSPLPSSASNSMVGDDPNDPEWTGTASEKTPRKGGGSKR